MKRLLILIMAGMFVFTAYSQQENAVDSKTTKKLTKEQKNELKRKEAEETAKLAISPGKVSRCALRMHYSIQLVKMRNEVRVE